MKQHAGQLRKARHAALTLASVSEDASHIVPSLPGCISEGNTRDEALRNIQEAVQVYLEPVDDDVQVRPNAEIVEIAL